MIRRVRSCHTKKIAPIKKHKMNDKKRMANELKDWYVRLDHLDKKQVITLMENQTLYGMPCASATELRKIEFSAKSVLKQRVIQILFIHY